MRNGDDKRRRRSDGPGFELYDTDQTDRPDPIGRGVWNGVLLTIVLLGVGIGMIVLLMR